MTKKHQPHYSKISSTRNSTSSSNSSVSGTAPSDPTSPRSVNDRLNQLRREQAPRASAQTRDDLASAVTQRTIPPALRRILNIPESDPPPPRSRPRGRRVPGPAAPKSWLHRSRHAPPWDNEELSESGVQRRVAEFSSLSLSRDTLLVLPNHRSLMHSALKALAMNWEFIVEYEQHYLPNLPATLKGLLLTYLGAFGAGGVKLSALKLLFPEDDTLDEGGGYQELRQLDFSNLLNDDLTLPTLSRFLFRPQRDEISKRVGALSIDPRKAVEEDDVVESWEYDAEVTRFYTSPSTARFGQLTRLSLFNPGHQASWHHLLQLSQHLSMLTHLSLGYWPAPSITPNAATTSVISSHAGPVNLGGTHFHSILDNDWYEAANILRRLSKNTYCLKWLDLEGCDWPSALTWTGDKYASGLFSELSRTAEEPFLYEQTPVVGPDWNGAWQQVEYLNLSQGWIPHDVHAIRQLPARKVSMDLLRYLREADDTDLPRRSLASNSERGVRYWLELEAQARSTSSIIRARRQSAKGKPCKIEHGWEPPVEVIRAQPE